MGYYMIKHLLSHGHSVTAFDIQQKLVDDVVALVRSELIIREPSLLVRLVRSLRT